MDKAIVKIKGQDYELKFTIGFWKNLKEKCDVTQENIDSKLKDDFGTVAPQVILYGIYYGLPKRIGFDDLPVTIDDIEAELDRSVIDVIEQAIINGMTQSEKKAVELFKKQREAKFQEIEDDIGDGKKKLQSTSTDLK